MEEAIAKILKGQKKTNRRLALLTLAAVGYAAVQKENAKKLDEKLTALTFKIEQMKFKEGE